MSILDQTDDRKDRHTKHYKIRKTDNGGCYIASKTVFSSLDELVSHYSSKCIDIFKVTIFRNNSIE